MTEKTIDGWLVVDWKTGKHKTRQTEPDYSDLGKNDLVAKLKINITVPEVEVSTLSVDIDVPKPQVHQAVLEALDESDLPGWTDAVADVVGEYDLEDDTIPTGQLADAITTQALMRISTRPDPATVRDYTYDFIREMRGEDG